MGSVDTASARARRARTLPLWVILLLCAASPRAEARGFEPWLQPEPLYERAGLLAQRTPTTAEIEKAETQLSWCTTALGDGHASTAQAQAQLGLLLLQAGELRRAENALRAARERLQRLPREAEGRTLLNVLMALGAAADLQGRAKEAQQIGLQALALRRRIGAMDPGGPLELTLAQLYLRAGAPLQAEATLRPLTQAAPLALGKDARRAAALHDLWAGALWELGRYEDAEAAERRVLQHLEQAAQAASGAERQALLGDLGAAQNNLALWLQRLGRDSEAEGLLLRGVQTWARLYGDRDPRTAPLQRNLAAALWRSGQAARAEAPLALAQQAQGESSLLSLWQGALYGEIAPSAPRATTVLRKVAGGSGEPAIIAQVQLADLLRQQGHLAEAAEVATAALEVFRRSRPATDPLLLQSAQLRAAIAAEQGQQDVAEDLLRRALAGAVGPAAPPPASALLALLRGSLGGVLLARSAAAPATHLLRMGQGAHLLAQALAGSAAFSEQIAPLSHSLWGRLSAESSTSGLIGALLPSIGADGTMALPAELASAILRVMDGPSLGEDLLSEVQVQLPLERGAALAEQLLSLWRQRAAALLFPRPGSSVPAPTVERLASLEAEIHTAEQELARRSPRLQQLLQRRELQVGQLQQRLGSMMSVLVLVIRVQQHSFRGPPAQTAPLARGGQSLPPLRGPGPSEAPAQKAEARERYVALVVRSGETAQLVDLGEAARLDATIDRFSQLVEAKGDLSLELRKLSELLVQPLLPLLPATGRLFFVAPPELLAVPLSALPTGGGLLCSRGPVQVLGQLADLVDQAPAPSSHATPAPTPKEPLQRLLLLGAPLLREPLPYLPRITAPMLGHGEMAEVNQLLRQHRYDPRGGPITGLAATRSRLRAWLPSRVVHVMAPLVVLPDGTAAASSDRTMMALQARPLSLPLGQLGSLRANLVSPMRAAIALAVSSSAPPPAPGGAVAHSDDGLLTAEDISQLDLRRTGLLVLSGPLLNTSLRTAGAPLSQLASAAIRAGAGQVVLTLWRSTDAAGRQLMGQLYRAWLRSGDVAEAVREVQLSMHAKGVAPIQWAGLRVVGKR